MSVSSFNVINMVMWQLSVSSSKSLVGLSSLPPQPHYVPDNYKRNGGRSSWKSERPKLSCKEQPAAGDQGEEPADPRLSEGRALTPLVDAEEALTERDADVGPAGPSQFLPSRPQGLPPQGPQDRAVEEQPEEETEADMETRSAEQQEVLELTSSSENPSEASRREAQRDRLNKILLNLLHQTASKTGEWS